MLKAIETLYNGYRFRSRLEARWAIFFDALGIKYRYEEDGFDLENKWYLPDFWFPTLECWIEIKPQKPTSQELRKAEKLANLSHKRVAIFFGDVYYTEQGKESAYLFTPDAVYDGLSGRTLSIGKDIYDVLDALSHYGAYVLASSKKSGISFSKSIRLEPSGIGDLASIIQKSALRIALASKTAYIDEYDLSSIAELLQLLSSLGFEDKIQPFLSFEAPIIECRLDHIRLDKYVVWLACKRCGTIDLAFPFQPIKCKCLFSEGISKSDQEDTGRLIAAYTAARQARFEHGQKG
jgi:hypothetical protein